MLLTVAPEETGLYLLEFLQQRIPAAPAAYLRQLVKKNRVTREGKPLGLNDPVVVEDHIHLPDSGRLRELFDVTAPTAEPNYTQASRPDE